MAHTHAWTSRARMMRRKKRLKRSRVEVVGRLRVEGTTQNTKARCILRSIFNRRGANSPTPFPPRAIDTASKKHAAPRADHPAPMCGTHRNAGYRRQHKSLRVSAVQGGEPRRCLRCNQPRPPCILLPGI